MSRQLIDIQLVSRTCKDMYTFLYSYSNLGMQCMFFTCVIQDYVDPIMLCLKNIK
jgi:hypothetical protein